MFGEQAPGNIGERLTKWSGVGDAEELPIGDARSQTISLESVIGAVLAKRQRKALKISLRAAGTMAAARRSRRACCA